ncbi:MAG TPA: carboxypeptidase regulatory-like domain-containing protein, partial [Thermoanaerobaculaceae bacterium]|nr:carboxypeptidase regulatory-like domain-containing protein [Thermoanaerobaculaceae bacterium]
MWLLALAVASSAAAGNITGTVKNAVTGNVLQGVTVKVTQNTSKKATTNTSGVYTISSVTAGTYTLTATKTGYIDAVTGSITVPASGTVTAPLILIQPKGTITGTVVSSVGGAAVSGATVKITGTSTSTTTATDGAFTLYAAAGSYTLTVTKTGWVSLTTSSFSVNNGQTTTLGNIPFVQNGTLTGTVVNSLNGTVVASAIVTVTGTSTSATTNTSGVYTLTTGAGPVTLTVTKSGWLTTVTGAITVLCGSTTTVPAIQLTQLATVTGTVTKEGTNVNLQGVTVTLQSDPTKTATTASNGTFSLASVPMGSQTLSLAKTGYLSRTAGPYTVNTTSFAAGTILLSEAAGTIAGTVLDGGAGNAPLEGVTINLDGANPPTTTSTDASGVFALTGVPAGSWSIRATRTGWQSAIVPDLVVAVGETTGAGTVTLQRSFATLTGTIREAGTDAPIEGATITVDEYPALSAATGSGGEYALAGVPWGVVHVRATHVGHGSGVAEIAVPLEGATWDTWLEIGRGTITGIVGTEPSGEGIDSVWVRLADNQDHGAWTDWDGSFAINDVPVGAHQLILSHNYTFELTTADVVVEEGLTTSLPRINLTFRPMRLFGYVRNPDIDQPVDGVTVTLGRDGRIAVTDDNGFFEFADIQPGLEVLAFFKDGYPPVTTDLLALWPAGEVQTGADLRPHNGNSPDGLLHGVVRTSTGAPVAGAVVSVVGGTSANTDADGRYQIAVERGSYALRVTAEGFSPQVLAGQRGGDQHFSAWQFRRDVVLAAEGETATIDVTTTDPITRLPRAGGFGILTPTSAFILRTGPDGHRTVSGVEPGELLGWNRARTVLPGATLHLDYQGEPTMGTTPNWALAGFVVRAGTSEPIEGALVTLTNSGVGFAETLTTDASGRFSRAGAPVGEYQVAATTPDGLVSTETATFTANDDGGLRLVDFEMESADESGVITTLSPVSGGIALSPHIVVTGMVELPLPSDFVVSVEGWIDAAGNGPRQVTYDPDGRHFTIEFDTDAPNGPANLFLEVLPSRRGPRSILVPVTIERQLVVNELSLTPSTLVGGETGSGTATLSEPAPPGGSVVHLSSSNTALVSVPATVTVSEGQTTTAFAFTTFVTTMPTTVIVSAVTSGLARSASVLVDSHSVASIALTPASVLGGTAGSGIVTLNAPAPPGGLSVALASSNPAIAMVPTSVYVPESETSAPFSIATAVAAVPTDIEITAAAGGSSSTAVLTVGPIAVIALSVLPADVIGGAAAQLTMTLNGPAPAGGATVALLSSDPGTAAVPPTVVVSQGESSAVATATTTSVASNTSVSISASLGGGATRSTTLNVNSLAVTSLVARPAQLLAAGTTILTVGIDGAAPAGGVTIALSSSEPGVIAVPAQVEILAGQGAALVSVSAAAVSTTTTVTITASANGTSQNVAVAVLPLAIAGIVFTSNPIDPGHLLNYTVNLTGPAPTGGLSFAASSSRPDVWEPPSTTYVSEGNTSSGYSGAVVGNVTERTIVTATVTGHGVTATATAEVVPPGIESLTFSQNPVFCGTTVQMTIRPYRTPTSPLTVDLVSTDPTAASVPAQITIPAYSPTDTVSVTTHTLTETRQVQISATAAGRTHSATLTVQGIGTLSGTLVEQATGAPVQGATVALTGTSASTTSDVAGAFAFHLAPGSYSLAITKAGLASTVAGPFSVSASQTTAVGPIALAPAGIVSGTVYYDNCYLVHYGGGPVWDEASGVLVQVTGTPFSTTTDSNGLYSLSLGTGTHSLTFSRGSLNSLSLDAVVTAGGSTTLDAHLLSYGWENRRVIDSVTLEPLSEAVAVGTVSGVSQERTTGSTGVFTLKLPSGRGTLTVSKPGYKTRTGVLDISSCTCFPQIDFPLVRTGTIAGTIVSAIDQSAITGATVTLLGGTDVANSGGAGMFSLEAVPGTHSVRVTAPGWAPKSVAGVTVTAAQTTSVGTIALDPGGTVTGSVVSTVDATPVHGVTVVAVESGDTVETDMLGTFTLTHQPQGQVTLAISKSGWDPRTVGPYTVTVNATTAVGALELAPQGTVSGTVVDAVSGVPLADVTVEVSGTPVTTTTGGAGTFSLVHTGGHYKLTLRKPGWVTRQSQPFTIEPNGAANLGTVTLTPFGSIHGTVTGSDNFHRARIQVAETGAVVSTYSEFQFAVPPGTFTILVGNDGTYVAAEVGPIVVAPGQTTEVDPIPLARDGDLVLRVVTSLHSETIPDVKVVATRSGSAPAEGGTRLNLAPGDWSVSISREGFLGTTRGPFRVTAGAETIPPLIHLTAAGVLIGQVIDQATGKGIEGATVTIDGAGISTRTLESGVFTLSQVTGTYTLSISAPGFAPSTTGPVAVTTGETASAGSVALTRLTGTVTGTVQNASGTPLEGATVTVNGTGSSVTTGSNGAFTIGAPVGTHSVTVSKPGWASTGVGPIEVASGAAAAVGPVVLDGAVGTLVLTAVDATTGAAVADVEVVVEERLVVARTDALGQLSLPLAPGYVTLRAAKGLLHKSALQRATVGTTTPVELRLAATEAELSGTLSMAGSGQPVPGATITLSNGAYGVPAATAVTDLDGRFTVRGAPGDVTVYCQRAGWTRQATSLVRTVVAGQMLDLGVVTADVQGVIIGGFRASNAKPLLGDATATWGLGGTATSYDGLWSKVFAIPATPGTSAVTISHPDCAPHTTAPVTARVGHTVEIPMVDLQSYGLLKGVVVSSTGEYLNGVVLTLEPGGRQAVSDVDLVADQDGAYHITAPAGTYTMSVQPPTSEYSPGTAGPITFADNTFSTMNVVVDPAPGWDIASITLDPTSVNPGGTATATITLNGPASTRWGVDVLLHPVLLRNGALLQSSSAEVTVPSFVLFDGGETSKTFPVNVGAGAPDSVTITATFLKELAITPHDFDLFPGRTKTATLTILAPRVTALTVDPTTVEPGAESTATVTLDIPARPGGATVTLSSSNPLVATVPASVLVPEGATTATFTVSTLASAPASTVTVTAAAGGASQTATLALALPRLYGVAPGWTLAGTADVIAYGAGFDQGSSVVLEGPVYALGQYTVPLCDVVTYQCPTQTLTAAVDAAGATASFTAPAGLSTGLYRVTVRRSGGLTTPTSAWLGIEPPAVTFPEVAPADHVQARPIYSGQTVTGTFVADGDPEHRLQDYNLYYFPATAGSHVRITLERVDTSKTWEHPDSLDPQIEVMAPDGLIPQNLVSYDRQPGLDLDAELTDAVLPETGLYFIWAGTSKGAGQYRLRFQMLSAATAAEGQRTVPLVNGYLTVPVGQAVTSTALALDARGYRLSGARVQLAVTPGADDRGSVDLSA